MDVSNIHDEVSSSSNGVSCCSHHLKLLVGLFPFQFKMFELESLSIVFMFITYRGHLAKERYFIVLAKSLIEKIPMLLL